MKRSFGQAVKGFILDHLIFVIFFISMLFKLYLFSKATDSIFFYNGVVLFFTEGFQGLFQGEGFKLFYRGLFLVSFGALLLLTFWTLFLKGRKQFIALTILNVVVSFIIFADLIYYRYFHDLISVTILEQAKQTTDIMDSIFGLIQAQDIIYFVDLMIIIPILMILLIKKVTWQSFTGYPWRTSLAIIFVIVGYFSVSGPIHDYISKYGNVLFKQVWYNMSVYNQTGLLGFHAFDIYKTLDENVFNKQTVTAEQSVEAEEWFAAHQEKLQEDSPLFGVAKDKNVIVLQLEAFNSFFINREVNGQEITPHLNRLIEESMYFNQFYHQTAQGRTADGEFLANQSLHPLSAGSVYVKYPNNDFDSLPAILKTHGYETAAFHAYDKSFWNRYTMYANHGFDHFFGDVDFEEGEIAGWTLGDRPFFQQGVDRMLEFEQPFYTFFVALSSHHPYDIQAEFRKLDVTGYEGIFANYLQSVHYVDQAVGEMVERLKAEGLWDESIFIVYGDHDYGVDEPESMAKIAGVEPDPLTIAQLYDQVPLIIHLPHDEAKGLYENSGGQIDIAPTILHLLGIIPEPLYMMGENLTDGEHNLVVFRYGSFTDGEVYYQASQDWVFENGACYDLSTREKTDVEVCREGHQEAQKRLRISDYVLIGDLIKKMRE